jgi:hypothetical protein
MSGGAPGGTTSSSSGGAGGGKGGPVDGLSDAMKSGSQASGAIGGMAEQIDREANAPDLSTAPPMQSGWNEHAMTR